MSTFKPWRVQHLELGDEMPDLGRDPQTQGLFLVFWWQGVPLGHLMVASGQLPMPKAHLAELVAQIIAPSVCAYLRERAGAEIGGSGGEVRTESDEPIVPDTAILDQLGALDEPLARLREHLDIPPTDGPSISVAICTRDRPVQLERCLRSLRQLSARPHEIIVVDNAPTSKVTLRLLERWPQIKYVAEPGPGLSVARNAAIRHASGDVVAFTDDDVVVHPDWLARIQRGFTSPNVMVVTGLVLPAELETEAQLIFEKYHSFSQGYRPKIFGDQFFEETSDRGVPVWSIGAGANMAVRREAFEELGGFDERLGAGASGCSEDSEFWYRVLAEGWECRYDPAAVVHHYHRADMDALRHQMYQYMRGHVTALLVQFERYRHGGNLRRALLTLPHTYARLLVSRYWLGAGPGMRTLSDQIAGCAAGLVYYLRNRNIAAPRVLPAKEVRAAEAAAA